MPDKSTTGAKSGKGCILYIAVQKLNPCAEKRAIDAMVKEIKESIEGKSSAQTEKFLKDILKGLPPEIMSQVLNELLPDFIGKLYGEPVTLEGVKTKLIKYIKREDEDREELRKTFDSKERKAFLITLGEKEDLLKEAGFSEIDIKKIKKGKCPTGWQVHHKLPIDDSGTNAHDNFVLIQNHPYHKVLTNFQNDLIRDMKPGESQEVEYPVPNGSVYPPETK